MVLSDFWAHVPTSNRITYLRGESLFYPLLTNRTVTPKTQIKVSELSTNFEEGSKERKDEKRFLLRSLLGDKRPRIRISHSKPIGLQEREGAF